MSNRMSPSSSSHFQKSVECENWPENKPASQRLIVQNMTSPKMQPAFSSDNIYAKVNEVNQNFSSMRFSSFGMPNGVEMHPNLASSCVSPANLSETFSSIAPSLNQQMENDFYLRDNKPNTNSQTGSQIFTCTQPPSFVPVVLPSVSSIDTRSLNKAISDIIQDLNSEVNENIFKSVYRLYHIIKDQNLRQCIEDKENLIYLLVNLSSSSTTPSNISRLCAACINCFSADPENILTIFNSGVMDIFMKLPVGESSPLLVYLIPSVHAVFIHVSSSRSLLSSFENLENFVQLIGCHLDRSCAILIDCLLLCLQHINIHHLMAKTPFMKTILTILRDGKLERLVYSVCKIIKEILKRSSLKHEFFNTGFFDALTKLLRPSSRRVAIMSLTILRTLSDICKIEYNYTELIDILLGFIRSKLGQFQQTKVDVASGHLFACALGILSNITCNNPTNKELLINHNIIFNIVDLYHKTDIQEILECSFSILKHITCRHKLSMAACEQFINSQGMSILVDALQKCSKISLFKTIVLKKTLFVLLSNIASFERYRPLFRELSITQYVAHGLAGVMSHINIETSTVQSHINFKIKPSFIHNCNKMLEACVIILYFLTSDEDTLNMMIRSNNLMCIFCKLLFSTSKTTMAFVICFLAVVSDNSQGLRALEKALKDVQTNETSQNFPNGNPCISRLKMIYMNSSSPASRLQSTLLKLLNNLRATSFLNEVHSFIQETSQNILQASMYSYGSVLDFSNMVDSPLNISPALSRISSHF